MLEPVGAIVFSSLLASRATQGSCSSPQSAVRVILHSVATKIPQNNRRTSLKRSRRNELARICPTDQKRLSFPLVGIDRPKCTRNHTLWCTDRKRVFMTEEIIPQRTSLRPSITRRNASQRATHTYTHSSPVCQQRRGLATSSALRNSPSSVDRQAALKELSMAARAPDETFQLEKAWHTFLAVQESGLLDSASTGLLLKFAERILLGAEADRTAQGHSDVSAEWGYRVQGLLDHLEGRRHAAPEVLRRNCSRIRALSLCGKLEMASQLLRRAESSDTWHQGYLPLAFRGLFLAYLRSDGPARALDFLYGSRDLVWNWLPVRAKMAGEKAIPHSVRLLRPVVYDVIHYSIEHPDTFLAQHRHTWDRKRMEMTGVLFIDVLCSVRLADDALKVLAELQKQSIAVPSHLELTLVRALVRESSYGPANALYSALTRKSSQLHTSKYRLSTGLYLYAHQGDVARAQEHFDRISRQGKIVPSDRSLLLHAYANRGETQRVVELFNQFYPNLDKQTAVVVPSINDYTSVIYAHAQRCDYDGMNAWIEKMRNADIAPDLYVYNIILQSFATRGDIDSLASVLKEMERSGIRPSEVSYNIVISLLARRKDPVAAEAFLKRAIQEGVNPDIHMLVSLMNSHVEAGSWQGVIRVFDYVRSSKARHIRLTTAMYNTLLKAYVLIGAPYDIVRKLFRKLTTSHTQPAMHTYALVIQSACDAGEMSEAMELFKESETSAPQWLVSLDQVQYVLTILMSGYLRVGDKARAKKVYDDMRRRGVQPTSVTFGAILKAYGNEETEKSLTIAENFLKTLMDIPPSERVWVKAASARRSALLHVYSPLMSVYARKARPEDVERLFQSVMNAGGEPTIGTLAMLLDAYRRSNNLEAALRVWSQIFQFGLRYSRIEPLFGDKELGSHRPGTQRQANLLCVPLSIYIDVLSRAGLHLEIAAVWKRLQMLGFSFDSHNWNHLAVALVRAGEPERAFEIVERVLIPYQKRSEQLTSSREKTPNSPFTFDEPVPEDQPEVELPRTSTRPITVRRAIARTDPEELQLQIEGEDGDDFAHPLHVLFQVSPSWGVWKPHAVVLDLLSKVLMHLRSGRLVQPVQVEQAESERGHLNERSRPDRIRIAEAILGRIYKDSPEAVRAVLQYEAYERQRRKVASTPKDPDAGT